MSEAKLLEILSQLANGPELRAHKAREAARVIRSLGRYRWTGLYDVFESEISVVAWDGPEPPTHPTFPAAKELNGTAVSSGKPVIGESGKVVGTIGVESDRANALSARDAELLAECARRLRWLWR